VAIIWPEELAVRRVVVDCCGDIVTEWFCGEGSDNHGWVRLSSGVQGNIGRFLESSPVDLLVCDGVLVTARDPESFDVLAQTFTALAAAMRRERRTRR
jgi:hypothetical protein